MKILIVLNVDSGLYSHRLPVALAALRAGHEVHIAASIVEGFNKLESYGFVAHQLNISRSRINFFEFISVFFHLLYLFWSLRPSVVHLVTIKPILLGGLAAMLSPVKGVVYAISGFGHMLTVQGFFSSILKWLVLSWYRIILLPPKIRVIVQNKDDKALVESLMRNHSGRVFHIPGSGVDFSKFPLTVLPLGIPIVLMVGRILKTKGIEEFVEAAIALKREGFNVKFQIAGDFDLLIRFLFVNKINYQYYPKSMVIMRLGGISTSGIKSIITINKEILHSCLSNNIKTNYIYIYLKYFKKLFEFKI